MRSTTAAQLFLLGSAHALTELSIEKKSYIEWGDALPAQLLHKRDGSGTDSTNVFSILTYSTGGAYYANVTIGTPPQNQVVILDTGSSDLYFDASTARACQSTTASNSCRGGSFNSGNSKTYKVVDPAPAFNTSFGDGSTASGPYAQDTLGIGSYSIANVQFGLAEKVDSTTGYAVGLMGVGYSLIEATDTTNTLYPNVPEILKDAGVIQSRLYSVYLNDVGYSSGSILFGGVDTSKYSGSLVTLNLLPKANSKLIYQFVTTVTSLSTSVGGKSSSIFSGGKDDTTAYTSSRNPALPVLLDTGSSAWSVPKSTYNNIISKFSYVDKNGLCSCQYRSSGDTLTLVFGEKVQITVPAQEFIVPIYNATTNQPYVYDRAGNQACAFMISPGDDTSSGFLTLGDAVLRSMYVVLDLDNGQVSLAQASVNSTASSNIVKVGRSGVAAAISGVSSIAKQTYTVAPQVKATQSFVASSIATPVGTATGIDAVPTDARPSAFAGAGGTSTAAAAGLVVPDFPWANLMSLGWATVMAVSGAALLL